MTTSAPVSARLTNSLKAAGPRTLADAFGGTPLAVRACDRPPSKCKGRKDFLPFGFAPPRTLCFLPCIRSLWAGHRARLTARRGQAPLAAKRTAKGVIFVELLNPEQLICAGCHREVVEVEGGWIHLDGSLIEECSDEVGEVAA